MTKMTKMESSLLSVLCYCLLVPVLLAFDAQKRCNSRGCWSTKIK